jgi:hypothetical protein
MDLKTYPEGIYIQFLTELSNGNLTGIENSGYGSKANSPPTRQSCKNEDLAK